VRFGIEAPRSITIDRAEIYERKKRAAQGSGPDSQSAGQSNGNGNAATTGNVADRDGSHVDDEVNGNIADTPVAPTAAAVSQAKARR
jgi:hypothetical protein